MKKTAKLTKIIASALIFCMLFALTSCLDAMGGLKVESFTVDRTSVKNSYFIGEEIDFSGVKIYVSYSDETLNTVYTLENAKDIIRITYDSDITATEGTKNVKVSMKDPNTNEEKSANVKITVTEDPNAVKFDHYEVDSSAMNKIYEIGATIDFTGVKVYEVMNDNTKTELTDLTKLEYIYDEATFSATSGDKTVLVKYDGKDAGSISIRINDPEKVIIAITDKQFGGEYKSTCEVGDSFDFSNITLTLTYADSQTRVLEFADLVISPVDTNSIGQKTVMVSFTDPVNDEESSHSFTVNVINKRAVAEQFAKPSSITDFESDNKTEGKPAYGSSGFLGTFVNGGLTYKVGDDNAFKFLPTFMVLNDKNVLTSMPAYYTNVTLSLYDADAKEYTALTEEKNGTIVTYKNGDTVIAAVDTFRGSYDFSEAAVGNKIKISVLPDETYYISEFNAVVLEVEVIDAYNVYSAKELAVVDNFNSEWNDFKIENGLNGINPMGIVLHNDISVTENDVPSSFFYESTVSMTYTDHLTGKPNITKPVGTKFLKDGTSVYSRLGSDDFVIEGNFFNISTKSFPLVGSPAVFGADGTEKGYGDDYSNAQLFLFMVLADTWQPKPDKVANYTISNLSLIGNASRDNYVDSAGKLRSAGGLIFCKSSRHSVTTLDNTICNSYFITYFPDYTGTMYVKNSKCYDSYQNAAFVWSDSRLEIKDSFINGTGGPVIIAQSVDEDYINTRFSPSVSTENTVIDSALSGDELWFESVNATATAGLIKALNTNFSSVPVAGGSSAVDLGSFVTDGKMNMYSILMSVGNSADKALEDLGTEGEMFFDGNGIARWIKDDCLWKQILNHQLYTAGAPCFIVGDGSKPEQVLFYVESEQYTGFMTAAGIPLALAGLSGQPNDIIDQADVIATFQSAETITLCMGGLSVVFEFTH